MFLQNELKQKYSVMNFLTIRLTEDSYKVVTEGINFNTSSVFNNDSKKHSDDTLKFKNSSNDAGDQLKRRFITKLH